MKQTGKLRTTYRYGSFDLMNSESVADHSWRLALMVLMITKELNIKIDIEKAINLALIHDIAESITGDIPAPDVANGKVSREEKERAETKAINEIKKLLPAQQGEEIYLIWDDYTYAKSKEAKFVRAMDKLEALLNVIETGEKKGAKTYNYLDFIATFADGHVKDFPALIPLLANLKDKLKHEYLKAGIEWKQEYDNYLKQAK